MKKTTVLLLTCALPVMLSACYSTMDEERARIQKRRAYQSVMGCQIDDIYEHTGLRDCVEKTAEQKMRQKKTVYLSETIEGQAVVVSKGEGDIEMLDPTAVYERVEYKAPSADGEENVEDASVVITDEALVYMGNQKEEPKQEEPKEEVPEEPAQEEAPAPVIEEEVFSEPSKSAEEVFREKFFEEETVKPQYEETAEKITEENPLEEKERKNEKEYLPTEQK